MGGISPSDNEEEDGPKTSYSALQMKETVRWQALEIQRLKQSSPGSSWHSANPTLMLSTPSITWTTIQDGGTNLREFKRFVETSRSTVSGRPRDVDISKEMMAIISDTLNAYASVAASLQGNPVDVEIYKGWERHCEWDDTKFFDVMASILNLAMQS